MARRVLIQIVLIGLLLLGALSLRSAFASAGSLTATDAASLLPSETPDLLGPINENGRTGWACKPERAASSSTASGAELPAASSR